MKSKLQRWGNSLAIRIHRSLVEDLHLREGASLEVKVHEGCLILTPMRQQDDLEALLGQVTDENLYPEFDWGPARGKESL